MSLFALGTIDPLYVDRFSGFDLPAFVQRVRLLSDGGVGPDEVLQSSGLPMRTATITGSVFETADLAFLRGYDLTKESITFTDANGNATTVRVLELTVDDFADWWTYAATLVTEGVPGDARYPQPAAAALLLTGAVPAVAAS